MAVEQITHNYKGMVGRIVVDSYSTGIIEYNQKIFFLVKAFINDGRIFYVDEIGEEENERLQNVINVAKKAIEEMVDVLQKDGSFMVPGNKSCQE